jgi:hypothetical protein
MRRILISNMGAVLLQEVRVDNSQARNSHLLKQGISVEYLEEEDLNYKRTTEFSSRELPSS